MQVVNTVLRALVDVAQTPFKGLPPLVGIVVWSAITAVGMLLVFKRTSNQEALAEVKQRIHASLFEIRLFNDDLGAILRAQMEILRHNATYLKLSVKPMLWMIVPLVLLIAQLQYHYGYSPLKPGDEVVVKAAVDDDWVSANAPAGRPDLELEVPDGLSLQTPGVWSAALGEMAWRLKAEAWGDYQLTLTVDGERVTKRARVSQDLVLLSPVRPSTGFVDQLTWPAEPPLPAESPFCAVELDYAPADIGLLGWHWQSEYAWMALYFLLSIVFAFALRKPFGVTI